MMKPQTSRWWIREFLNTWRFSFPISFSGEERNKFPLILRMLEERSPVAEPAFRIDSLKFINFRAFFISLITAK